MMIARIRNTVLAMLAFAWLAPVGRAQVEDKPVESLEEVEGFYGKQIVDNTGKKQILRGEFVPLWSKATPSDADKTVLAAAARFYVLRVTWPEYANSQEKLEDAIHEFRDLYGKFASISKNSAVAVYFNDNVAANFKKVFQRNFLENKLTSINAAQMLPGLGKVKSEEISNFLTELIRDPEQHDAVKLYAIRALKDYFPIVVSADPKDQARDLVRVQTLTNYIERKWPVGKDALEIAAISFLSGEAIQILALAKVPAVPLAKKTNKNEGQIAITLLKVLAKNELSPPPPPANSPDGLGIMGLAERCQASFGLCEMQPDPNYQADISVYAIGVCLSEFIDAYKADEANLAKGNVPAFHKNGQRKVPQLPWKTLGDHWKESLNKLTSDKNKATDPRAYQQAKQLQEKSQKLLQQISTYGTLDADAVNGLRRYMGEKEQRPLAKSLFKWNTAPEVNLGY